MHSCSFVQDVHAFMVFVSSQTLVISNFSNDSNSISLATEFASPSSSVLLSCCVEEEGESFGEGVGVGVAGLHLRTFLAMASTAWAAAILVSQDLCFRYLDICQ